MKDIHSHLLYGIDDGSKTIEESLKLIKKANNQGITDLILTPHYIERSEYNCCNEEKKELFNRLVDEVRKKQININLFLGNEVFISNNLIELLKKGEISTLNGSKYLLVEFPMGNMLYNTKDIIYDLIINGYIPIVAHPERYRIFQRHPEHIEEYLRMGVLLQCNYKSLFGKYGRQAKKTIKYFLENGYVTFLGSDCHHEENFEIKKMKKKLQRILKSDSMIEDLLENNFNKVIENKEFGIRNQSSSKEVKI